MHGNGIKIALAFVVDKDLWQCEREWARNFFWKVEVMLQRAKLFSCVYRKENSIITNLDPAPAPLFALVHFR